MEIPYEIGANVIVITPVFHYGKFIGTQARFGRITKDLGTFTSEAFAIKSKIYEVVINNGKYVEVPEGLISYADPVLRRNMERLFKGKRQSAV